MDDAEAPDGRLLLLDEALTSEAGVSHAGVHRGAMRSCSSMQHNARDGSPEQMQEINSFALPFVWRADLEGREVPGTSGEAARSLAQFMRDEGLSLARTQVAVDYSYWPAHAVLQVRACPARGCR